MVDVWLIVLTIVVPVILCFANFVFLGKYIDPEHAKGHHVAKAWILLGLLLAEGTILLLPLDVGNNTGVVGCDSFNDACGGLDLSVAWSIVYVAVAVMVVIIIPFNIFFYEADDEGMGAKQRNEEQPVNRCMDCKNCRASFTSAVCYTGITLVISLLVLVISFFFLNETKIPFDGVTVSVGDSSVWQSVSSGSAPDPCGGECNFEGANLDMEVSFVIYLATLLSFVGWFIFVIYAGIGLVGLPIDGINAFRYRPRLLTAKQAKLRRNTLRDQTQRLIQTGNDIAKSIVEFHQSASTRSQRRKFKRTETQEINKFRLLVEALENDVEEYQMCEPTSYKDYYNPIIPWLKLAWGIFSIIVSLLWIIHIIIFMLIPEPPTTFLNDFLLWFDTWFPFLGTVFITFFTVYLTLATIKGNTKFGSRFFLIKIHPMTPQKTLINSFLFNVGLILLTALPVVQFAADAFSQYARLTDAQVIFSVQMRYMRFFTYFFDSNAFIIALLVIALLAAIYFASCPSDKAHRQMLQEKIRGDAQKNRQAAEKSVASHGGAQVEMGAWGKK
eukprot:gb/GECG01016676.1/.p1 GENE.gb/GECG01016676.1/~~gb/GECG01016676.1/.p1  ORF type:complete len:556 (+),score=43.96 gb/GECG01016676.1/:1-1668(+)